MPSEPAPPPDDTLANLSRRMHLPATLLKFLFVGILAYAVNQGALLLLYEAAPIFPDKDTRVDLVLFTYPDARLLITSFIAVQCAVLFKFGIHEHWTFRDRRREGGVITRFIQFNLSSFLSPIINLGAVNILTPLLDISPYASNTIGAVLGFAVNWLLSAHIIWPHRHHAADTPAAP
ncbi:MAG TPA: GtrA family protein [Dehalococcoidia bacterium]|nr:GtrA family protein [Dehalococcoidia bacterium]